MTIEKVISDTLNHFKENNIELNSKWVNDCLEFLITNNKYSVNNISNTINNAKFDNLMDEIYKQLLISDITSSCLPKLPELIQGSPIQDPSIKNQLLKGTYLLQILSIVNISEENETRFQEDNSQFRTLKLLLSDGKIKIQAFEHKHISSINPLTTKLGSKCFIKDVSIRRGILLLDNDNFKLIGGSIKELERIRSESLNQRSNKFSMIKLNGNINNINNNTVTATATATPTNITNTVAKQKSLVLAPKLNLKSPPLKINTNINNSNSNKLNVNNNNDNNNRLNLKNITNNSKIDVDMIDIKEKGYVYINDLISNIESLDNNELIKINALAKPSGRTFKCNSTTKEYIFYLKLYDGTGCLDVRVSNYLSIQLLGDPIEYKKLSSIESSNKINAILNDLEGLMTLRFDKNLNNNNTTSNGDNLTCQFTLMEVNNLDSNFKNHLLNDLINL